MANSIQTASDAELTDSTTHCVKAINANLADYPSVTQQQANDLKTVKEEFAPEVTKHVTKTGRSKGANSGQRRKARSVEMLTAMVRNISNASRRGLIVRTANKRTTQLMKGGSYGVYK